MGKKKKPRPRKAFIEGIDRVRDEYKYWKKTNIIKRLVGIFEVTDEQLRLNLDELLLAVGLDGYSVVRYKSDHDNTVGGDKPFSGTGCAVAVRNVYGKVVPVVFVGSDVQSVSNSGEISEEKNPEFEAAIQLLVLLHELGHADDISKSINYDHNALKVDLAGAEAYAHEFVCKQAQKNNYSVLLELYLQNVDRMAKSAIAAERIGAELFLKTRDVAGWRGWIAERRRRSD